MADIYTMKKYECVCVCVCERERETETETETESESRHERGHDVMTWSLKKNKSFDFWN